MYLQRTWTLEGNHFGSVSELSVYFSSYCRKGQDSLWNDDKEREYSVFMNIVIEHTQVNNLQKGQKYPSYCEIVGPQNHDSSSYKCTVMMMDSQM